MAEKMLLHCDYSFLHPLISFVLSSILLSFPPVEFRWAGVLGWSGAILEHLIL